VPRRIALDIENELSERELQLLVHATKGLTDQAIANELGISLSTIATYWGRIRIKLGPLNRTELVARYLEFKSTEEIFLLLNEAAMLRRQLETSKSEDSELMLALNHLPDAVALVDHEANYLYVNEVYCKVTGYSPDEFVGQNFRSFFPEGRHERLIAWMKGILEDPTNPEFARNRLVFVRHKSGRLVQFDSNTTVYETSNGIRIVLCGRQVE
jgi:PAS domain S-box-containing protein